WGSAVPHLAVRPRPDPPAPCPSLQEPATAVAWQRTATAVTGQARGSRGAHLEIVIMPEAKALMARTGPEGRPQMSGTPVLVRGGIDWHQWSVKVNLI